MKKQLLIATALIAGLSALTAAPAMARVDVDLHIGVPVYAQPVPVYPAPVYVQPRPVYGHPYPVYPSPVYVQPRPIHAHPSHHGRGHWNYQPYRPSQYDRDRDGVPNYADRDRDGDGVANRWDRRPDNRYQY